VRENNHSPAQQRTLGILLATSPENLNKNIVIGISEAALKMGIKVKIFLMDDGIYNVYDEKFMKLAEQGADISLCSLNAGERKIKEIKNVTFGSQFDHAEIVKNCDRYLGFFR
jgi:sulfur relay (sulfurtransferase) complex TusBCD TusD component (DsrE family)